MAVTQCAICLYVQFLARETDQHAPPVEDAVTMVDGTALCALHLEDYDRDQRAGQWLLRIAARILGVPLRRVAWGHQ